MKLLLHIIKQIRQLVIFIANCLKLNLTQDLFGDRQAKEEIRQLMQPRYCQAKKADKQDALDEFCALCGYRRKYAITLLKKHM